MSSESNEICREKKKQKQVDEETEVKNQVK